MHEHSKCDASDAWRITNGLSAVDGTLPVARCLLHSAAADAPAGVESAKKPGAERTSSPPTQIALQSKRPTVHPNAYPDPGSSQRSAGLALSGNGPQWERV
jgi:hypothetical protein